MLAAVALQSWHYKSKTLYPIEEKRNAWAPDTQSVSNNISLLRPTNQPTNNVWNRVRLLRRGFHCSETLQHGILFQIQNGICPTSLQKSQIFFPGSDLSAAHGFRRWLGRRNFCRQSPDDVAALQRGRWTLAMSNWSTSLSWRCRFCSFETFIASKRQQLIQVSYWLVWRDRSHPIAIDL